MNTENIVKFLQTAYTDQGLADLRAHTEEGKLSARSCCCLIGITNAPHALRGEILEFTQGRTLPPGSTHHQTVRLGSALADSAECEFFALGTDDAERRQRLLPLILAEEERRARERHHQAVAEALILVSSV